MRIYFRLYDGTQHIVETSAGQNLMLAARSNGISIEGACDGSLSCSTCHMIIDPAWYGKLPPPRQDETDLLDLASGLTRTSRLSCQIMLTEALDGLKVSCLRPT